MADNKSNSIAIFNKVIDNKAKVTAGRIIEVIKNGDMSPSYLGVVLKKMSKVHELVTDDKDVQELIMDDIKKNIEGNGKTAKMFGASITVANKGYWDYSNTDDPYLEALENIKEQMEVLIKARKDEIQAKAGAWDSKNSPKNIVDFGIKAFNLTYDRLPRLEWDEGIEVIETNPPVKRGKEHLRFTL